MSDPIATPTGADQRIGCALALLVTAFLVWTFWTVSGALMWINARARFPRSPYLPGQFASYVMLPAVLSLSALAGIFAARRWRMVANWIGIVGFVELFFALPFLLSYGGGV